MKKITTLSQAQNASGAGNRRFTEKKPWLYKTRKGRRAAKVGRN